jgi:hypothetical protein
MIVRGILFRGEDDAGSKFRDFARRGALQLAGSNKTEAGVKNNPTGGKG